LIERFLLLLHASGTVCHFTSLEHHLYRLSEEETEAVFVQPQLPILISCSLQLRLRSRPSSLQAWCLIRWL